MAEKKYVARFEVIDATSTPLLKMMKASERAQKTMETMDKRMNLFNTSSARMNKSIDLSSRTFQRAERASLAFKTSIDRLSNINGSAFSRLNAGASGLARTMTSLPAMIAGVGASLGALRLGELVIGGGMQKELTQMQMGALLGSKSQGADLYTLVQDKAMQSMFSEKDFSAATNAFLPVTKDFEKLSKLMDVNERLASSNMLEGMDGASFSLREAMSGDIASIAERFNISKSDLRSNEFDSSAGWEQNLNAVDKTLDKMGYTAQYVDDVNDSSYSQMQIFKSNFAKMFTDSGEGLTKKLGDPLKRINSLLASEKMSEFVSNASDAMANGLDNAIDYVDDMNLSWSDAERLLKGAGGVFTELKDSFGIMLKSFTGSEGNSPREMFEGTATSFERMSAGIKSFNDFLAPLLEKLERFSKIGTMFYGENSNGTRNKGIATWGADWLTGNGGSKSYDPNNYTTPWESVKETFQTNKKVWNDVKSGFTLTTPHLIGGLVDGSHMNGLSNVPFNGYIAELHQGERVLTANENQKYSKGGSGVQITINHMEVRKESDIDAIGQAIVHQLEMRG